jgi:hypothetical protein
MSSSRRDMCRCSWGRRCSRWSCLRATGRCVTSQWLPTRPEHQPSTLALFHPITHLKGRKAVFGILPPIHDRARVSVVLLTHTNRVLLVLKRCHRRGSPQSRSKASTQVFKGRCATTRWRNQPSQTHIKISR